MDTNTDPIGGLAAVVKEALAEAKISRRDAAERTGIPLTTLQRRLNGPSPFLYTELVALARELGTTVSALTERAETRGAA